ncbi:tetratricopeptide repeat protein [Azotobacter salinestris]|uniref:tetratricopeptide repeat protein n=1 Tax=Azotobacter salinestris TaxID=69964 RepID=UPI001AD6386B|nr:tetratricopeptide repeat protein [Azotobacter salinestris]
MKRYRLLFLGWVALSARAEITEQQIEADCLTIASYSAQGGDHYRQRDYAKARELYEQQAAWSESRQLDDARIATAYNNVAVTYIREGDYLKARAWLQLMPDDSKSVHNLGLIEDKLPAALAEVSASAEGEYWQYAGKSLWNVIRIGREGKGLSPRLRGLLPLA